MKMLKRMVTHEELAKEMEERKKEIESMELTNKKVFYNKVKQISLLVDSSRLTEAERGEIYNSFKNEYKLTDESIGNLFGVHGKTISREIVLFKKLSMIGMLKDEDKKNKLSELPERIRSKAIDLEKSELDLFLEKYDSVKYSDVESIIKVLKKDMSVNDLEEIFKKQHEENMALCKNLREWLKIK